MKPTDPHSKTLDRPSWTTTPIVWGIVAFGVLARLSAVWLTGVEARSSSEILYATLAIEWSETWGFQMGGAPTAIVAPFYPILLGLFRWASPESWVGVGILQSILGGATVWFVYRVAWRVSETPFVAWGAAILTAFYPPLILQAARLEPTAAVLGFLLVLSLWLLTTVYRDCLSIAYFMSASFVFALAFHFSPEFLVLAPVLACWAGVRAYHRGVGAIGAVAFCMALVVALMPWVGRNFWSLGSFVPITTGAPSLLVRSLEEDPTLSPFDRFEEAASLDEARERIYEDPPNLTAEIFSYRKALSDARAALSEESATDWIKRIPRCFSYWVSDYSELRRPDGETTRGMAFRVLAMTLSILALILALVGMGVAAPRLNSWILWMALVAASFLGALFGLPKTRALAYFPVLAVYSAWGASFLWTLLAQFLASEPSPRPFASDGSEPFPLGEDPVDEAVPPTYEDEEQGGNTDADREPRDWPVPHGELDPIRQPSPRETSKETPPSGISNDTRLGLDDSD